ncbi:C-reactive protein-like [Hyperolius riggenbachi]|uniref:C-reactive protein-like n=1 Tax=Hyperolius riggenbachi TaxID=752182 RepID=UPI0035A2B5F4
MCALLICSVIFSCLIVFLDLSGKVFLFPKETSTDHVIVNLKILKPLHKVTVCLRYYTDLTRGYTPFSLATPGKDNAFIIFLEPPHTFYVGINQEAVTFKTEAEVLDWKHICVTWDSQTRVVQLWVNGKLYPRKVTSTVSSIAGESSTVLGQDQDSFGGEFQTSQSFVGELSDIHMWNDVLSPEDIQKVFYGDHNGNLLNWKSFNYAIKGDIIVQSKLQCKSWGDISSLYTPCQ